MSQDSNSYITTSQSDSQEIAEPARTTKRLKRNSGSQKHQSLTNVSKSQLAPKVPAPAPIPTPSVSTTKLSSTMSYTQTTTTASYPQENTSAPVSPTAATQQRQQQQTRRTAAAATSTPQRAPIDPRLAEQQQAHQGSVPRDIMEGFSASAYSWPILFAIVPPLGALVWGSAEVWGDFLLLILISYYLYNFIKVPWELYYAARSRRVINQYSAGVVPEKVDPQAERRRRQAAVELRRQEFSSLMLVVASPFLAGYSLRWTKSYLSEYDRYMSNFNIVLFVFAASIRPFVHVVELVQKRALYLQEQVHYPSTEVELLKRRVQTLEQEINILKKAFATKKDLGQVASGFAPTLSQFNRSLKRFEKKEQYLRTYSEERFDYLEAKLREFDHYVSYRIEQDQRTSPQRYVATLLFLPLNLTVQAIGIVAGFVPFPRGLLGGSRSPKPIGLPNGKEQHHVPITKEAGELEKQFQHRQTMEAGDEDHGSESEESVRR